MLADDDVIEAVRDGAYHIYPVRSVDEGLALLTGKVAGRMDSEGHYPPDSVHGAVAARLEAFAKSDDDADRDDDAE